jgi:hypothetical protein
MPTEAHTALYSLMILLVANNSYTPPEWCQSTFYLIHKKGNSTILDNYKHIALMNNLHKL